MVKALTKIVRFFSRAHAESFYERPDGVLRLPRIHPAADFDRADSAVRPGLRFVAERRR